MLEITIPKMELWDESKEEFIYVKETTLQLEHSLVSLSKWESKWCKVFIGNKDITPEQMLDYIRCMTLNKNVDPITYQFITSSHIKAINEYIEAPMTATWFSKTDNGHHSSEQITSELIYYWMVAFNIPFECQKWHLNRLITLIKVCNIKNQPSKKMSRNETLSKNAALNAARRKQFSTKG